MEEYEKLARAKRYMEDLAAGRDPVTGEASPLTSPRLRRCFQYVAGVLAADAEREERRFNREKAREERARRVNPTAFTPEALERYPYSDEPIPVTKVVERFNSLLEDETMKKLCYKDVCAFLEDSGALAPGTSGTGRRGRVPTPFGETLGIRLETRQRGSGELYTAVTYSREAQRFIVDNIHSILLSKNKKGQENDDI